jgi:Rieske Fe-S protein
MSQQEPQPPETVASRRRFLKHAVLGVGAAGAAAGAVALGGGFLPPMANPSVSGVFDVSFASSEARSAWHNDLAGRPMRTSDFPGPGFGAQGRIQEIEMDVVVVYLIADRVDPSMRGVVPPGFAAFNASCPHLRCTASLWRDAEETAELLPIQQGHDMVVCSCHLGTFDPYNRGRVTFGPPPRPLEQLKLAIAGDHVQIAFDRYLFGGETPQV